MKLKVERGTRSDGGSSLCDSCRSAAIIRGGAIKEEIVYCGFLSERIAFDVKECSGYDDRSKPTLRSMREIAWELKTDGSGRKIGFTSPDERRAERARKDGTPEPDLERPMVLPDGTTEW